MPSIAGHENPVDWQYFLIKRNIYSAIFIVKFNTMIVFKILKVLLKIIGTLVLSLLILTSGIYFFSEFFDFPEPEPFTGNYFYNPYEDLPDHKVKANFHAHSKEWGGITNGHNSEEEIHECYNQNNYDVIGISNYHRINKYNASSPMHVNVYEHGINMRKAHLLVIEPNKTSMFDFPFYQTAHHQQTIIQKLKRNNGTLVLAHPSFGGGRPVKDMRNLVNYDFTEVLNHYRTSYEHWDAALTAGRLSWVLGNDDTHDIIKEPTCKIWNVIYSDSLNFRSVLRNMLVGHHYAITTEKTVCDNTLISCELEDDMLKLQFEQKLCTIQFIGNEGTLLHEAYDTDVAHYAINSQDAYVRAVGKAEDYTIYLNPIVRYDGSHLPYNNEVELIPHSYLGWVNKIIFAFIAIVLLMLLIKLIRF